MRSASSSRSRRVSRSAAARACASRSRQPFALALKLALRRHVPLYFREQACGLARAPERVFEAAHDRLGRGRLARGFRRFGAQQVALLALGFEPAQSFERREVRARVLFRRALTRGGAAGVGESALQIAQAARGRLKLDFEPVGDGARLRDAALGLVERRDGSRARLGVALEGRERRGQLDGARAGRLVLFDRHLVARELRLGRADADARLRDALVDETGRVAQTV